MNITDRLYTYPVLSDEKDDYVEATFSVESSHEMAGVNTLKLSVDIEMNCPGLQQLINCGDAQFLFHIECSTTAFRTVKKSQIPHLQHDIPISRVNGLVERVVFIVATRNIKHFKINDWNEDFEGMEFNIEKGSVLAYQNLDGLDVKKDYEELSNASSIFMIYKRNTNEERPIEVDMESNKIKLGLGINEYSIYTQFYKRSNMQSILNSMIIFPALVFVFEELKQEDGIERYRNREWFGALERAYEKRGINLKNEILNEDKKSIILAQDAMENPISKALTQILSMYEEEDEDL